MLTCGSGSATSCVVVSYDYGTDDKSSGSNKPLMLNGDLDTFSWRKMKMYNHIMGLDEELWDILVDGVAVDRKKHIAAQKKLYNKHHKIRGTLVAALPHKEYLKISDKSTAKAMFASLCSNYEGNKKVKEAKATMLVEQYELFRMKEDEDIETMYSRFQTLVSGLQIQKKSYLAYDHVNKILRILPAKWRPKVTSIEEVRDLNTLSLEDLISSLKFH